MSHYKPYPAYKDSVVEWIGRVPEHWVRLPFKRLATICNGQDYKHVADPSGDIPVMGSGGEFARASKPLFDGESVLLGRKGTIDKPLYRKGPFWPVDTMFYTLIDDQADGRFVYYAATNIPFDRYSTNTALPSMTQEDISSHMLAAPKKKEQTAIAAALDRETARIDALIAKKTRFIELLKEKRQALITHAVTKGLSGLRHSHESGNPESPATGPKALDSRMRGNDEGGRASGNGSMAVPMKDSGVEWIGDVPEHWGTAQLGKVSTSRCDGPFGSSLKSEHYAASGVRVVRLQNIGWAEFKGDDAVFIPSDYWRDELGGGHDVIAGDVLIAGLGDEKNPLGRACVAPDGLGEAMVKADCYRFRVGHRALPKYVALALSATARAECGFLATGATRDRLTLTLASARTIPLPPIAEQREIVSTIATRASRIDLLIERTVSSITLLKERRSALITAAVTGQIDLREAASPGKDTSA